MRRITQIRYGDIPIKRIYLNNEIIYDKVLVRVIAEEHLTIQDIATAISELTLGAPISARDIARTQSLAISESAQISDSAPRAIFDIDAVGAGKSVIPNDIASIGMIDMDGNALPELGNITLIRLRGDSKLITKASPMDNTVISQMLSEIKMINQVGAKNVKTAPASSKDKIDVQTVGAGRSIRIIDTYGYDKIHINSNTFVGVTDTVRAIGHGKINAKAFANGSDAIMVYTDMHSSISTTAKLVVGNADLTIGAGYDNIGIDVYLVADSVSSVPSTSHSEISINEIAFANDATAVSADAYSNIEDTTNLAHAILWRYPKDMGDYWLIVQAFEADKTNDTTLEVI